MCKIADNNGDEAQKYLWPILLYEPLKLCYEHVVTAAQRNTSSD